MTLLEKLKIFKEQLKSSKEIDKKVHEININNIEIIIENNNNLFKNEIEIIKTGALELVQNKNAESIEEGIIVFATMFRGLSYDKTEKDENGNIKIILKDIEIKKCK